VLRQEELVQEPVNLEQAFAVQQQPLSIERQESLFLQLAIGAANLLYMSVPNLPWK